MTPTENPDITVSFIVPAHDEEELLPRALESIQEAVRILADRCEILVVDDASTDRTAEIARAHGARVIPVQHRQISKTRNAGAREAHGRFLVFVDADSAVTPRLVRAALVAMRRGAVGGGSRIRFDGTVPRWGRVIEWISNNVYVRAGLAPGSFLFCTKDAFDEAGGFDETLYGAEEAVFSRALRQIGEFAFLREVLLTSGRKVRAYSARELFGTMFRLGLRPSLLRAGESPARDVWYGERRPDPGRPPSG